MQTMGLTTYHLVQDFFHHSASLGSSIFHLAESFSAFAGMVNCTRSDLNSKELIGQKHAHGWIFQAHL